MIRMSTTMVLSQGQIPMSSADERDVLSIIWVRFTTIAKHNFGCGDNVASLNSTFLRVSAVEQCSGSITYWTLGAPLSSCWSWSCCRGLRRESRAVHGNKHRCAVQMHTSICSKFESLRSVSWAFLVFLFRGFGLWSCLLLVVAHVIGLWRGRVAVEVGQGRSG